MRTLAKLVPLVVVAAFLWFIWAVAMPVRPKAEQFVLLRPGWSTRHIAEELQHAGVVHSADAFLLYHYLVRPTSLKAGEYRFDSPASAFAVHARLARGDVYRRTVVVPEGFNMFDIAAAIEAAGLGPRNEFLEVARNDVALVSDIDPQAKSLEGYLFPDTYQFTRTQTMGDMAAAMVKRFRQEARGIGLLPDPGDASRTPVLAGADVRRVVIMASIVEKETAAPEERPLVASVYYNRLGKRMALDADPTVIYAALLSGRYQGAIYQSDLQSDSPYNTYKHAGLPPGPIANPGLESLKAALHPAATDYYYFVADGSGHHRLPARSTSRRAMWPPTVACSPPPIARPKLQRRGRRGSRGNIEN